MIAREAEWVAQETEAVDQVAVNNRGSSAGQLLVALKFEADLNIELDQEAEVVVLELVAVAAVVNQDFATHQGVVGDQVPVVAGLNVETDWDVVAGQVLVVVDWKTEVGWKIVMEQSFVADLQLDD